MLHGVAYVCHLQTLEFIEAERGWLGRAEAWLHEGYNIAVLWAQKPRT